MKKLILALTYYNAPQMLEEQVIYWQGYFKHEGTVDIKIVLIDDGSRGYPAEKILKGHILPIPLEVYRITQDIPFNVWGARNLAFNIAMVQNVPWVLCLDIDHVFPFKSFEVLSDLMKTYKVNSSTYYQLSRYEKQKDGYKAIGRHNDTFLINPEVFWRAGGYDEDLKNFYYNGAAFYFRSSLARIARGEQLKDVHTIFYPTGIIPDASPLAGVERKTFTGYLTKGKKPSVLNFDWERVI
jgi:hypothetical protein